MKNKIILLVFALMLSLIIKAQIFTRQQLMVLKTSAGNIYGTLKVPEFKTKIPVALIVSGSGPTDRDGNTILLGMTNNSLKMLAESLCNLNIASLRFDKRGVGESKTALKREEELSYEDYINDVKQWINLLAEDKRFSEIVVIGHSEGSYLRIKT